MLFVAWFFIGFGVWLGLMASKWREFLESSVEQKLARGFWSVSLWPLALWNRLDANDKRALSNLFK